MGIFKLDNKEQQEAFEHLLDLIDKSRQPVQNVW